MDRKNMQHGWLFFKKYLKPGDRVLEVGSQQIRGQPVFRSLMPKEVEYIGIDIVAGSNVDKVINDPYDWWDIPSSSFDIVVSAQAFEHMEFFWQVFREMVRVCKLGGYIFLQVPEVWHEHKYPVDCWRILPDGMAALAKWGNVELIESSRYVYRRFAMCKGIFRKP